VIYRYFGVVLGYLRRRVTLVSATLDVAGAHAAVWSGCNAPDNTSWVQGGVFLDDINAKVPSVYIEEKGPDVKNGYQIYSWPMPRYGIPVLVVLTRKRGTKQWRVTVTWDVDGTSRSKRSQWITVPHPTIDADLELLGPSQAVAKIGRQTVTGSNRRKGLRSATKT
jgi:hypothetical protein